jgi:pilus assembly protein CpaE
LEGTVLQSKPIASESGPATRFSGLVYTQDDALARAIDREIRSVCRIITITASIQEALQTVEQNDIQASFVHVNSGAIDDNGMALVRQLRRAYPQNEVFIVADRKDPDLILEGLRLGILDVILPAANGTQRFLPVLKRALGRMAPEGRNGFIHAIFSLKGGQGVTSLSVNLADHIQSLTGDRVLLLDLNLYMGDIGAIIDIAADFTPYDLIRDLSRMDENLLFSSLHRHPGGLYVLPSPATISDAERVHRDQITAMLTFLKQHFTHIVIDLPHEFSERALAAVESSDQLIILVEPDLVSVKSAQQTLTFFQELNYGDDRLAVVLNRISRHSVLQPEDVRMVLKQPLLATVTNDWSGLARSARKGETLRIAYPRHRITRETHRLAARLIGMTPPVEHNKWLSWLKWFD